MATPLDTLSLSQLLDLAIGMPDNGAVHFAAMRKLLQAVLEHLDVQYLSTQEPWPGQLTGPSLADVAADVKEIKKAMEVYKKQMSQVLHEEIAGIKAKLSHLTEDIVKIQKAQSHMAEDMKNFKEARDEDMVIIQVLREEIDRLMTTQNRMEGEIKKMKDIPALMKKMGEDIKNLREDTEEWREESRKETSQQLEALLQETKQELQKMEEQQAMRITLLEQLVTETVNKVNEQLGDTAEIGGSQSEEQEEGSSDCSSCTFNIRGQLGKLLQRCEKLQERVETLESRHIILGNLRNMMRKWGQDLERLHNVEATIVHMQGDCEKLSFISGTLQEESQQKQKAIEMLFQSLEKLQKEKADEQDMLAAMDVKADKAALGTKVNCSQFDANMERLDERMQELQSQISGQKEHWNKVQQQLSFVEEEKLDRLELKVFSEEIEENWNRNIEELENRLMRETAAGIKKQLPVPFTCLSCDRMLTMHVPGPYPETLPYLQPLPPSKEPQLSQRRPVAHGSVPRVPQSSGDHQSSSSMTQRIKASLQRSGQPEAFLTVHNKPRVNQLLGTVGPFSRGYNDQLPLGIRAQDESGPATRELRPRSAPRRISWAAGLVQPLQPRRTATAPPQLARTVS